MFVLYSIRNVYGVGTCNQNMVDRRYRVSFYIGLHTEEVLFAGAHNAFLYCNSSMLRHTGHRETVGAL
jgi:hypothetical protein